MDVTRLVSAIRAFDANDKLPDRLSADEWRRLGRYLSVRFIAGGEELVHEGDPDRELYIIAEGEFDVVRGSTPIAHLVPGTVVGEGTFFSGQPRSASVVACDVGVVWTLTEARLDDLCEDNPALVAKFLRSVATVLAVRMQNAAARMQEMASRTSAAH